MIRFERLYQLLLRLYPAAHRRAYGPQMALHTHITPGSAPPAKEKAVPSAHAGWKI